MSARDELIALLEANGMQSPLYNEQQADALIAAGYRQIFDGDCGLSSVEGQADREAAEAWMRWSNLVSWDGGEPNGIAAMKQMLTEFGYRRVKP